MQPSMAQPPIEDYAIIGDGRTAALCSKRGSIDWLCLPRFDSKPIFSRVVAGSRGGCFSISVDGVTGVSRRYLDGTAVLETTWRTPQGTVTLTEGMVLDVSSTLLPQVLLVRRLRSFGARVSATVLYSPMQGMPGVDARTQRRGDTIVSVWGPLAVGLATAPHVPLTPGREHRIELEPGAHITFALTAADRQPLVLVDPDGVFDRLRDTERWWRAWSDEIHHEGPHREAVMRSLITLRLLTYTPSGAPVAAPTTSLPEVVGGGRNWDYRYAWPRDASIGSVASLYVGQPEEAESFMRWLVHASRLTRPRLKVLYTLDGRGTTNEEELKDVDGYRGSRPVRVGNGAEDQHQLDVYGWVVDAAWGVVSGGYELQPDAWRAMASFADFVADRWRDPDAGIWEVRGQPQHFVHSKLMGWVALDRVIRLAEERRVRRKRVQRWTRERDAAAAEIRERGWDDRLGSYTRAYGSGDVDASLLLLPTLDFEPEGSPRLLGTIDAVRKGLGAGGPLVYRYTPETDDLEGREGAFLACCFWLPLALARVGKVDEATDVFVELCGMANDVGLFAEEIDPETGAHLGNFPQAISHAALLQAALAIRDATGGGTPRGSPRTRRVRGP